MHVENQAGDVAQDEDSDDDHEDDRHAVLPHPPPLPPPADGLIDLGVEESDAEGSLHLIFSVLNTSGDPQSECLALQNVLDSVVPLPPNWSSPKCFYW